MKSEIKVESFISPWLFYPGRSRYLLPIINRIDICEDIFPHKNLVKALKDVTLAITVLLQITSKVGINKILSKFSRSQQFAHDLATQLTAVSLHLSDR